MSWVWLSSGFVLPLGIRLHSKTPLKVKYNYIWVHWPDKLAGKVQSNMDVTNRDLWSLISVMIFLLIIRQSSINITVQQFFARRHRRRREISQAHRRSPQTLQAVSCISYILLYDWSCHLREQINRTFQFRNCHRKFFCSFWCIHGNNPRTVSVWGKRLHKNVLAQANAIYPWVKELV